MAMAAKAITITSNPPSSTPLKVISSITSLLQTLNPINPQTHNPPDPSPLNHYSPHLNPTFVIDTIKNQTSPYHALFFFNWASKPHPNPNHYSHTNQCYVAITDLLLAHNLFSLATHLLESANMINDFMMCRFIKAHGDKGHIRWALHLFDVVKKRENGHCLASYNAMLGVLVRVSRVDLARSIFYEVVSGGVVKPDIFTYTTMIRGFVKMGMIDDAQKVFDEMTCAPNLVTYNTLISGLCKKGKIDRALGIVERMRGSEDCLPDTVTYTSLIDGYCKKGELDEAKKCFDEMVSKNCNPNFITYNALVNGLCLSGNVDEANKVLTKMRLDGIKGNISTHTSLLKGYCIAGRSNEAIKHFNEMSSRGIEPDEKAHIVLLIAYCNLNKPNEAISLLCQMLARGISPHVSTYNIVLRGLVQLGEIDRAILFLNHMPQMGMAPNCFSYDLVLLALVKAKRRMVEVEGIVSNMLRDGHILDANLYSSLVEGYCEDGNEKRAMQVCLEMIHKGYMITLDSFSRLATKFCAKGQVVEVHKLLELMSRKYAATDLDGFRRVLDGCLSSDNM